MLITYGNMALIPDKRGSTPDKRGPRIPLMIEFTHAQI